MTNVYEINNSFTNKSLIILQFNVNILKTMLMNKEVIINNKRINIALTTKRTSLNLLKFIFQDIN